MYFVVCWISIFYIIDDVGWLRLELDMNIKNVLCYPADVHVQNNCHVPTAPKSPKAVFNVESYVTPDIHFADLDLSVLYF